MAGRLPKPTVPAAATGASARPVAIGSSQGQLSQPGWVAQNKYDSVHFTLMTQFKDDDYARRVLGDLEQEFSILQKEFWDFIPPQWREAHVDVVAFGAQEAFDDYAARDTGMPRGEKGYSSTKEPRIVYLRQGVYYRDVMIVAHELTHLFNRFCTPRTPIWLDEGMAQYYADLAGERVGNAGVKAGVNPEALIQIDAALRSNRFVPLSGILMMDDASFYGERVELNYAESWALVYYLRRGLPRGDEMFSRYYYALAHGAESYQAFGDTYGLAQDIFTQAWLAWLQGLYNDNVPKAGLTGTRDDHAAPVR